MAGKPRLAEDRLRATFVRRAIETNADLLAGPLHRYADEQNLSWQKLAESLNCTEDGLNRVACCKPPRSGSHDSDIRDIASVSNGDREQLIALLSLLFPVDSAAMRVAQGNESGYSADEPASS